MANIAQKSGVIIRRGAKKHGGLCITRNLADGAITIRVSNAGKVSVEGPGASNYAGVTSVEHLQREDWLCFIDEILRLNRAGKPSTAAAAQ